MLLRAWLLYAPCRAGLLDVPVGGGPPASRPRREPSARRVDSKAGQAPPPPTGTAARPYLYPVCVTPLIPRSTTNFACNSLTTISNIEFTALELQRFWTLLKVHAIELHAELMEPVPTTAASFESGPLRRCSRF